MKKWVILGGVVWLLLMAAGLAMLVMKPRHVALVDLKEARLDRESESFYVSGEFLSGTALASADHELEGDLLVIRIFAKPALGSSSRFQILLPEGVSRVQTENPDGTRSEIMGTGGIAPEFRAGDPSAGVVISSKSRK